MKHDFIDKYSHIDSPVHRLDPRMKVLAALAGIVVIVTEPLTADPLHFLLYTALIAAVVALSRLPVRYLARRILVVMPFILMAALFYPLSLLIGSETVAGERKEILTAGAIIFLKAWLAVVLLIILSSTERFHRLLMALRSLRVPVIITTVSALLYRYVFLISDEALKTTRARQSRTPGKLKTGRIKTYGNQVAVIFLRSWERSQTIYKSMLSRGFNGEFPDMQRMETGMADIVLPLLFVALLLTVRLVV